ncbi:MAG: DUF3990 domain-containing protein [Lachnospiraceae bacterium]
MQTNILTLYHGSENTIPKPLYGKGSSKNDYGKVKDSTVLLT